MEQEFSYVAHEPPMNQSRLLLNNINFQNMVAKFLSQLIDPGSFCAADFPEAPTWTA
jgi:hypothetical protein